MTQEKMTPLRERMIEDCVFTEWAIRSRRPISGRSRILLAFSGARPIPRRQMIFAHINCI